MLAHEYATSTAVARPVGLGSPPAEGALAAGADRLPNQMAAAAPDLRSLTLAIRRGDAEAFSRFYDLYAFRLYRFLLVLARGDEDEAREVVQAVLIKLAKGFKVFENDSQLWPWLRTLAKNAFIDHRRALLRRQKWLCAGNLDSETCADAPDEHLLAEALRQALESLAPADRELLEAAYVDERPLRGLADESGQTYKAVESRLMRLRQRIKDQLIKYLRHETGS